MLGMLRWIWFGRFGLADLVWQVWIFMFEFVVWFGRFGLVGLVWYVWFCRFGILGFNWQV